MTSRDMAGAWREQAYCRGQPIMLFFDPAWTTVALQCCAACTVRVECRAAAIAGDEYGVWGGTTERERRAARAAV